MEAGYAGLGVIICLRFTVELLPCGRYFCVLNLRIRHKDDDSHGIVSGLFLFEGIV
jgi:hypothetical protein